MTRLLISISNRVTNGVHIFLFGPLMTSQHYAFTFSVGSLPRSQFHLANTPPLPAVTASILPIHFSRLPITPHSQQYIPFASTTSVPHHTHHFHSDKPPVSPTVPTTTLPLRSTDVSPSHSAFTLPKSPPIFRSSCSPCNLPAFPAFPHPSPHT